MTAEDFVKAVHIEYKERLEASVSSIRMLGLSEAQQEAVALLMKLTLTDLSYRLLMAIDGEANIGGIQHLYRLLDEDGNELTGGEIEVAAYEYFHGSAAS